MGATPFKVVSWSAGEPITQEKMEAMTSNDNWLRNHKTESLYSAHNMRRDEGVRTASGLVLFTSRKQGWATKRVNFGGWFSPGCRPVVTTGCISASQRRIFVTLSGPGQLLHPTADGFDTHVAIDAFAKKDIKITRNFYVSWHAVGY